LRSSPVVGASDLPMVKFETVLSSIPAFSDSAESEVWQMKEC
jgi:hypothetical protein